MDREIDDPFLRIEERKQQWLIPLKEDLADWLNRTLGSTNVTADNFMEVLDDGVIVCRLAKIIHEQGRQVPAFTFKCWANAGRGSFRARDNVDNFLRWSRKLGINEAIIFESDGLVMHTQVRRVVLCLLELGRIAARHGIDPPGLVKLEREIDELDCESTGSEGTVSSNPDVHGEGMRSGTRTRRVSLRTQRQFSELDKRVLQVAKDWGEQLTVRMLSQGKYLIGGKIVFVRLLNGRHVMVRVGGGWDTLEHFVSRHDPSYDPAPIFLSQRELRSNCSVQRSPPSVSTPPRPHTPRSPSVLQGFTCRGVGKLLPG